MQDGNLRDLYMAGVRWELGQGSKVMNKELKPDTENHHLSHLTHNSVPPIAPVITIDTAKIDSIDSLIDSIKNFNHPLRGFAKNTIAPQVRNQKSEIRNLLIITDMPSADDDESGQILAGAAGELMDKMLGAIGLNRGDVSITPLVFWRTAGGTTPTADDLGLCRPFIDRLIELSEPVAILTLGTVAATEIAGARLPTDHGKSLEFKSDGSDIPVIPIYHPNYLLLKPDSKRPVWDALQNLEKMLKTK